MNGKNVLGIIFSNLHDEALRQLTDLRTMGSVPFCSRYRLIDFPLSNMVNSGVTKVGIVTKANYQSLMDHIGTGKPWDLSRKYDGMFLLPPFTSSGSNASDSRVDSLYNNRNFIEHSKQEHVLITDCNVVTSLDYSNLFDFHEQSGADITIVAAKGKKPQNIHNILVFDRVGEDGRIRELSLDPKCADEEVLYSTNIILIKKYVLDQVITKAFSHNCHHFQKDVIMSNIDTYKIHLYAPDTYSATIDSLQSYYDISMSLLRKENRDRLFDRDRPIYTKERDDMPARYGIRATSRNCLIADGCVIDGEVENCILFKGVQICKGAVVKDCILMQDTYVGENAKLNCVIADKNVTVKPGVELSGARNYPVSLGKSTTV